MSISIPQYNSQVSIAVPRPVLPDPSTASALYQQGAQGAQQVAQGALNALYYVNIRAHQEAEYERRMQEQQRRASIAYNADDARLSFDQDMHAFLRDGSQQYADNPEAFYKAAGDVIRDRAGFHAMNRMTDDGSTAPRFENDPEALTAVRGDLLQRGQDFLKKANEITTQMTVSKGLKSLSEAEDDRLNFARNTDDVRDVLRATSDMADSYSRSAGTIINGAEAVKSARDFADKAWLEFHDAQAQKNPDGFLIQVSKYRPQLKTDAAKKQYQENNYRSLTTNIGKVSEVTLVNALNLGNIDVAQYKDLLKSKGMGPEYVADRTYSGFLSEIDKGDVPVHSLGQKVSEWAAAGMDSSKINALRSAVQNHYDRVVSYAEKAQRLGEEQAKQKADVLESKIYDMLDNGKITSVDQVKPLLNASVESTGMTPDRKLKIETIVRNSLGVGGPGDPHLKNVWELGIRSGNAMHTTDEIRLNKSMNLDQKNDLLKILKDESGLGGMKPEDKAVYDEYKKKVAILFGEKGIAASYTTGEARVLATALSRYSELVRGHKMHPVDAAEKVQQEMRITSMNNFYGGTIPDIGRVTELAKLRAAGKPTGVANDTLDFWIAQYRQKALVDSVFPKADPMQGVTEGRRSK